MPPLGRTVPVSAVAAAVVLEELSSKDCGGGVAGVVSARPVAPKSGDEERNGDEPRGSGLVLFAFACDGGFGGRPSISMDPGVVAAVAAW